MAISPNDLTIEANCQIFERRLPISRKGQSYKQTSRILTNRMIWENQFWSLEFTWIVNGPLACLLQNGYWKAQILFEQMGRNEINFNPEKIVLDEGIPGYEYTTLLNIPPYTLPEGIYQVVCCLEYQFKQGAPSPIVGFEDKGLIKISRGTSTNN